MKTMVVALSVLQYYVIINLFVFIPQNFCVKGLELFSSYLFKDILELYDWNLKGNFYFQKKRKKKLGKLTSVLLWFYILNIKKKLGSGLKIIVKCCMK